MTDRISAVSAQPSRCKREYMSMRPQHPRGCRGRSHHVMWLHVTAACAHTQAHCALHKLRSAQTLWGTSPPASARCRNNLLAAWRKQLADIKCAGRWLLMACCGTAAHSSHSLAGYTKRDETGQTGQQHSCIGSLCRPRGCSHLVRNSTGVLAGAGRVTAAEARN